MCRISAVLSEFQGEVRVTCWVQSKLHPPPVTMAAITSEAPLSCGDPCDMKDRKHFLLGFLLTLLFSCTFIEYLLGAQELLLRTEY